MSTNAIDPEEEAKKFRKTIADHIRRLSSEFEGERAAAVNTLRSKLKSRGLDLHAVADVIEGITGEIGGAKLLTDDDAKGIYERGVEEGRAEEARKKGELLVPSDFYDEDGHPRWNAIALFCQNDANARRLTAWEEEFIDNMAGKTMWREPTEKEAKHLLGIFIKLGGRRSR